MAKEYACVWLDNLAGAKPEDKGIIHYVPKGSFRVTRCGRMTGIMLMYLTKEEAKKIGKLCKKCFGG